jgi:hypothetical protein
MRARKILAKEKGLRQKFSVIFQKKVFPERAGMDSFGWV